MNKFERGCLNNTWVFETNKKEMKETYWLISKKWPLKETFFFDIYHLYQLLKCTV